MDPATTIRENATSGTQGDAFSETGGDESVQASDPKSVVTCYSSHKKLTETWQAHDQSASAEEELRRSGNVSGNHSPLLKTETPGQTWWHTPATTTLGCEKKKNQELKVILNYIANLRPIWV